MAVSRMAVLAEPAKANELHERVESIVAGEHLGGYGRRDASLRMATEPVGHREEKPVGEIPVLVLTAMQAHVTGRPEVE